MARLIPAVIQNALTADQIMPSISLTSQDLQLRLQALAVTGFGPARNAALVTSAGTLLRASVTQGTDPNPVSLYRIANPAAAASWHAAGTILTANGTALAGTCLVQTGTAIRCFWIDATTQALTYAESTDDGITWSPAVVVHGAYPAGTSVCAGIAAASIHDVYSAWYNSPIAASILYRTTYTSSWSAYASAGPASPAWGGLRGIAADNSGSSLIVLAGVQLKPQQTGFAAGATSYNGTSWSSFATILPMDSDVNGLGYKNPTVHRDPATSVYYAGITLQDDGSVSGVAQNRTTIFASVDGITWNPYLAIANTLSDEAHWLTLGGVTYLFDNQTVLRAPVTVSPSDLSSDVLAVQIHERIDLTAAMTITLSNASGQYNAHANLVDNAHLQLSLGYSGTVIPTHTACIDALEYICTPDSNVLVIHARDVTKFLDQVNPTLRVYQSQTIAQLVTAVCGLANVSLSALPATPQFSQVVPCFTLLPGYTYLDAIKQLSAIYDFNFFATTSPAITIVEPQASDAPSFAYSTDLLAVAWQESSDQPNIVRVVGASTTGTNVFADVTDAPNLQSSGAARWQQVVERMLTTSVQCALKAALVLRRDQMERGTGTATVRVNPQLELNDVVTLTEPRIGLAMQAARITAIRTGIDWQRSEWVQNLELGLP